MFTCILACDDANGISRGGKLPWRNLTVGKADMRFFRQTTLGGVVIMGSKTWLGSALPGRVNVVLSRKWTNLPGATVKPSLDDALEFAQAVGNPVFVIGGAQVFHEAFCHPKCEKILVTRIPSTFACDRHVGWPQEWQCLDKLDIKFGEYSFPGRVSVMSKCVVSPVAVKHININYDENAYLSLASKIIDHPETRPNRTGIATKSSLCEVLRFRLQEGHIPLLTTKFVPFRSVCVELLWFLGKPRDTKFLTERGVHIWDANTTTAALRKRKLELNEGEVGPIYGNQWRNFNGQGIDQLERVIEAIRRVKVDPSDPEARRLIVTAWNPAQNDMMCLPPCHILFQFHVRDEELDCVMMMRSADMGLGVPFNIASYSLLLRIVAHLTGMRPGYYVQVMNDCHVYVNHIAAMREQISRRTVAFPRLKFSDKALSFATLDDFAQKAEAEDFIVEDYFHQPKITMDMAV